jgi:plastocyanin
VSHRAWATWFVTLGIVVLAISEAAGVKAATVSIAAVNYKFMPPTRTVHVGDTVVWLMSGDGHTVRSGTIVNNVGVPSSGPLNSGFKSAGQSYSFTFTAAGTYPFYCEIHADSGMKGTITVVAAAATPKPTPRPTPRPTPAPTPRATPAPTPRATPAPTPRATPAPTATPNQTPLGTFSPPPSGTEQPVAVVSPTTTPLVTTPSSAAANGADTGPGATPLVVGGILLVIGILGVALLRARRNS